MHMLKIQKSNSDKFETENKFFESLEHAKKYIKKLLREEFDYIFKIFDENGVLKHHSQEYMDERVVVDVPTSFNISIV